MSPLACPKCRQAVSDAALDAGPCPNCGYDDAMVIPSSPKGAWLIATLMVVGTGVATAAFLLVPRHEPARPGQHQQATALPPPSPAVPGPDNLALAPHPRSVHPKSGKEPPATVTPAIAPRRNPWNLAAAHAGPVVRIDPKEVREMQMNDLDALVLVADMNRDEHLTIKGHVGMLKIGTISGNARLDASGLVAREIIITGDVNQHAVVKLNAPRGRVLVDGHIEGNARVTANAPHGEIMVAARSGKLDDDAELMVVARDVDIKGRMAGRSRLVLTLTGGGRAAIGVVEGNAVVIRK